ncbi:MAG: DUF2088 domain-containing protein, partial [Clostridia bacterium]|nr:DUF2088 domain-containing protein [Clostridia bacterium]
MKLQIPYETAEERGVFLELEVDDSNLAGSFIPQEQEELADVPGAVMAAVENPIGGKKLSELLTNAKKVAIITENQFRQAPIKKILPLLIKKIKDAGASINIVIGCGKVPALSQEEIVEKLGSEVVNCEGVEVFCNDVSQADNYVFKGISRAGTPVWVHKKVAEADAIVTLSTTQATL